MTLLLSTQINVPTNDGIVGKMLDQLGDAIGVPGLGTATSTPSHGLRTPDVEALRNYAGGVMARLASQTFQRYDSSFVGSGTEPTVSGGSSSTSQISTLEESNERTYYTQSPTFSVIIKKKMFSGLQDLNKPELLGPGETWLMRATKRLIARKCAIMADYERLTKLEKLDEFSSPNTIMQGLLVAAELGSSGAAMAADRLGQMYADTANVGHVDTLKELRKAAFDRQVPSISTYYVDRDMPIIDALGIGTGTFEIATINTLQTNLEIGENGIGNGSCTFTIEDPYQILIVTEEDIEASIRDTALSSFVHSYNRVAAQLLQSAQKYDNELTDMRNSRGVSPITFSVSVRGGSAVATIDNLSMEITTDSVDDVPTEEALNSQEKALFSSIMRNLEAYNSALSLSALRGAVNVNNLLQADMQYARQKMRQFYLGKAIIQVMDSVHVYIDSSTRRYGEGEEALNTDDMFTVNQLVKMASAVIHPEMNNHDQLQLDENALRQEFERLKDTTTLTFENFRLMRGLDSGGGSGGTHVFGGIVSSVSDRYNAQDGKFVISVSCEPNMGWLKLSRYNTQPSYDQTEGIIYDPLTPFIIKTDVATGLPTGEIDLTPENKARLGSCGLYMNNGQFIGKRVNGMEDLESDIRALGGNLIPLFEHVPGLLYRWKEGIMTATYNMQTIDPKSKNIVDKRQLRRDVGFFSSNTPFDNMDAANIISTLVTGFPYNYTTFLQSAIQTGAYVLDTTLNRGKDFFHSFLDIRRSINNVQGNFIPFKSINTSPQELANSLTQAIGAQQRLTNVSSQLTQLRTESAKLDDKVRFLDGSKDSVGQSGNVTAIASELKAQKARIDEQITILTSQFQLSASEAPTENNAVRIAGNDVLFDFEDIQNKEDFQRFGDKLTYSLMRRREDVIYNKDKNYLVISDDYDKDYDIQAFVLKLREQSPNMWRGTWDTAFDLCTKAAETLNFEFYTDTQGHIVFRPPQYNRTPLSVLEAMFLLNRAAGIRLFPDFLLNLFQKREDSIISDVIALELEMKMNLALLGASNINEAHAKLSSVVAKDEFFISEINDVQKAVIKNQVISPAEKLALKLSVQNFNALTNVANTQGGVFSSVAQQNLQSETIKSFTFSGGKSQSNKEYYDTNVKELSKLTGRQMKTFPEFAQAKVGAVRNGQSTPSTDVANITSTLANLVSRRSSLLRILERVLEQNDQISQMNEDGTISLKSNSFSNSGLWFDSGKELMGLTAKFVEDTRKDTLGHLSAERFIIRDEHVITQEFTESPPAMSSVVVTGTDALVGEGNGNIAGGMPLYLAYGVDFDTWRQYGWRTDKAFDKPFFWDAELQCAPYAVMLLSRQRRDIVTGSVTRFGNEFYQLGDVVYSTSRQLLYYVTGISHSIAYDGKFETTLKLHYGHPPGDYIPTPLDIIGKSMTSRVGQQNAFRTRRLSPITEAPVKAVLKFPNDKYNLGDLLSVKRNVDQLQNVATTFKSCITQDKSVGPRLYIMTFTDDDNHTKRRSAVKSWFITPQKGVVSGKDIGADGIGGSAMTTRGTGDASNFNIDASYIFEKSIRQCESTEDLTSSELELIRLGLVASDEAYRLSADDASDSPNLTNIVEVRIVYPPSGGWTD